MANPDIMHQLTNTFSKIFSLLYISVACDENLEDDHLCCSLARSFYCISGLKKGMLFTLYFEEVFSLEKTHNPISLV